MERNPPDPACVPRPVSGAIVVVTDAAGARVDTTRSATDGSYQVTIGRAGTFVVSGMPVAGLMGPPHPVTVTLPSGVQAITRVDLEYDTGIR